METHIQFNPTLQDYLSQSLIDTKYVYFDHWSGLHLLSGLLLGVLFAKYYRHTHAWLMALTLLMTWEMFELSTDWIFFAPETLLDKTWDIIVGMTGFSIVYYWLHRK